MIRTFIIETSSGKRLKTDGKRVRTSTLQNYIHTYNIIKEFSEKKNFELLMPVLKGNNKREMDAAQKYWEKFYIQLTNYMYYDKNYFDNYVGMLIKNVRTIMAFIKNKKNINIGYFYKSFYATREEIPIIALNPQQLNYLIYDEKLNADLPDKLKIAKDMFVFGCTVCLRVSDLMDIKWQNIIIQNNDYYLNINSKKTGTFTSIKLPSYAVEIIQKYKTKKITVFPKMSKICFNDRVKKLGIYIDNNEPVIKTRTKRGVANIIYKDKAKKKHFVLADLISSHTMRRTGITTMLRMGMPEFLVRKISGHSANSREFFRYVQLAQEYLDQHTDAAFDRLKKISTFIPIK